MLGFIGFGMLMTGSAAWRAGKNLKQNNGESE